MNPLTSLRFQSFKLTEYYQNFEGLNSATCIGYVCLQNNRSPITCVRGGTATSRTPTKVYATCSTTAQRATPRKSLVRQGCTSTSTPARACGQTPREGRAAANKSPVSTSPSPPYVNIYYTQIIYTTVFRYLFLCTFVSQLDKEEAFKKCLPPYKSY